MKYQETRSEAARARREDFTREHLVTGHGPRPRRDVHVNCANAAFGNPRNMVDRINEVTENNVTIGSYNLDELHVALGSKSTSTNSCHSIFTKLNRCFFGFQIGVIARSLTTLELPLQKVTELCTRAMEQPESSNIQEFC